MDGMDQKVALLVVENGSGMYNAGSDGKSALRVVDSYASDETLRADSPTSTFDITVPDTMRDMSSVDHLDGIL